MPADYLVERPLHDRRLERPLEGKDMRFAVGRRARSELLHEPYSLLGVGESRAPAPGLHGDGVGRTLPLPSGQEPFHELTAFGRKCVRELGATWDLSVSSHLGRPFYPAPTTADSWTVPSLPSLLAITGPDNRRTVHRERG
jgi:hypothetical protein